MAEQTKVKFYRGKEYNNPEPDNGEIIMLNDAFEQGLDSDQYNEAKKFGSIYQDDKIVGTTRAEQLMTTESIQVIGGPLADDIDSWPDEWTENGNKTIPAGTSMLDILIKLFSKEINGTAVWGKSTWSSTPAYAKPTVTLSSNGPVEYGTSLTISTLSAGATTTGKRKATCTCTYGYHDDEGYHSGNKVLELVPTISGERVLTATWNNESVDAITGTNLVANKLGENKLVVTQSGQTATHTAFEDCTVYPSTNTKKKIDIPSTFSGDEDVTVNLSSTNNDTINAYYKYYYFTSSTEPTSLTEIPTNTSSSFLTGYSDGATTKTESGVLFFEMGPQIKGYILLPEEYELTQISYSDGSPCKSFELLETKYSYKLPDNNIKSYNIYCWDNKGNGSESLKDMIITKKTSDN